MFTIFPAACRPRPAARFLAVALCLAAVAPASARDDGEAFADSSRLVAVGGSLTEIVYALGAEDRLVARDSTSTYPEAATKLPDIGYMRALSPEGVLSVEPSAILALAGSGPPETIEVLEKASVPIVTVPEAYDRAGIVDKIAAVGAALDLEAEAGKLAGRVADDVAAAEALTADLGKEERRRVLFVLSMEGGRIMASGSGTAADGVIAMAGGVNAVEGYSGYKQLSDEAVIEAAPDMVLMMERGGAATTADEEVLAHPAIAATPAAEREALVRMEGSYLLGFGPRTAGAVRDLATELYGRSIAD